MVNHQLPPIKKHTTGHMFQALLNEKSNSAELIVPNIFVHSWNECDALILLRSGYIHEIEMKLSRSDFLADFKKTNYWVYAHDKQRELYNQGTYESLKHVCLANGVCYPNRFSFLVPDGLVEPDEVPNYAGLMYFTRNYGQYGNIKTVRRPKLLHKKTMVGKSIYKSVAKKFSWRYNNLTQPELEKINFPGCHTEEHF